jgi:tetratricopeptide (TPR) repeat protein
LQGKRGDLVHAEQLLRRAIETDPEYTDARLNLALIEAARDENEAAGKDFKQVLSGQPDNIRALIGLGMVQTSLKEPAAIETFRHAAKVAPHSSEAHLNLGISLAASGKTDEALIEFSTAETLSPQSGAPRYHKGRVLADLHRSDEARSELTKACHTSPALPDSCLRLGLVERDSGRFQAAINAFQQLLSLEPRNSQALFLLGNAFNSLGRTNEAIDAWKRSLDIDPTNAQAVNAVLATLHRVAPAEAKEYQDRVAQLQRQYKAGNTNAQ